MKKKLQLLFSLVTLLCVGITANAQEFPDGKYYLQNVTTGLYWGAANSWGTQASLLAHPDHVTLVSNEDGTYKLESQVTNGGTSYYFNGSFMDNGAPVSLTIAKSGDYYTFSNGETYYGAPAAGTAATFEGTTVLGTPAGDSEGALWKILSAEEMAATLATATESNPVDATFLITDHTFGRNHRNVDAWTNEGGAALTGGNSNKHDAEKFHGPFNVYQKLAGAPAGVYKFTAQGFYRQDGEDNENLPVFYANEETAQFPIKTGTENSMADACTSFEAGLYIAPSIYVQVTEDGELTVGAKLEANDNLWCIWDNFVLTYYGPDADIKTLKFAVLIASVTELRAKATELKDNAGVTPATVAVLEAALTGSEDIAESEEAYNTAIAALKAANKQAEFEIKNKAAIDAMYALLENTNVYTTEAYETYKAKADEYLAKYNDGTLTETIVNPSSAQGWRSANNYDDLLLSVWSIGGEQCKDYDKALYINTWSVEGENDGTNFKVPFFEYFTGDAESLGANTLAATMEGLTPGTYAVTAWVRNQPKSGVAATDVTGITLQVNDGEAVDATEGEAKGGFNIGEFSAVGVVGEDGKLTIKVNVAEDNNSHWLSFKNVKFVPVVDPSSCIVNAEFDPAAEPLGWTENVSGGFRDINMGQIGTYEVRFSPATVDETHLETEYCAGFECRWNGNFAAYTQTTGILPPGNYKLTFDVENVNGATANANYNSLFTVTVGENVYTDNNTEWMKGKSSWTSHSIPFTITAPAPIAISLGYGTGSNNISADNTPALYVSHLQLSEYTLEDAQADANAELAALAPIGEGIFMYAQADIDAAKEAVAAATTIKEVKAVAMPTPTTPDPEKQYTFKLKLDEETSLYMNLTKDGIKIEEEPTLLSFVETETAGQYYLDAEGELSVGRDGGDNWTMSTAAEKRIAWSFTALGNGEYNINNLVTVGRFVGTNANDKTAGSPCYCDKQTSNGNVVWTIEEYVVPVPTFAGIIEQTLTHPQAGVMGTETTEQTVKIAEAGEGLVDVTFSGFKFPVMPFTVPEFTISNVTAETAEDGSITYAAGNFQVEVPSGMMSAFYNGTLEGTQASAEATPLFKLVLQNATTDEVYFGADQEAIDAYKASFNEEPEPELAWVDLTDDMFHEWTGVDADAEITNNAPGFENNIGKEVGGGTTVYGNGSVLAKTYAALADYKAMKVTRSNETGGVPRLLFGRSEDNSQDFIEIADAQSPYIKATEDDGLTWIIDLDKIKAEKDGLANLNVIKVSWGGAATITSIQLGKVAEEEVPEIAISVERIVNQGYTAQTESFDFAEVAELLGVDAITEDMLRMVEADGTLNSDIVKYDGWFNKDGYAETWGANSFVCVKLFQALEDGEYEICDMNNPQVDDEVTAKWAVVNGEKTVYININVKFIKKPITGLTFDELNKVGDDVVVSFTSECGKCYEGLSGNVEMADILNTLGVDFIYEVDIYAVQSDGSLDNNYKLGTTDGWRNADGDWQSWGADARFYVKANFAAAENHIYEVGGMDGQTAEPATYTATYAFVKKGSATHDAVVLKVTLTYDDTVSIDGIDAAKAKGNGKYLQNGKVVIVKNGKTYSVSGVEIK